jgi:transmembrane sensor
MGNFECNSIEDLVFSRSFRDWVLERDSPEAGFWENWIVQHPDKREIVQHAKAVVYALQLNLSPLSEEETGKEIGRILQKLRESSSAHEDEYPYQQQRRKNPFPARLAIDRYLPILRYAAVFMILCLSAWFYRNYTNKRHPDAYEAFQSSHSGKSNPLQQQVADASTGRILVLPDGSTVHLVSGSKLYYASEFFAGKAKREVYLTGEAFFEIKKNAARPFYVYTSTVITKVLGTSFRIEAYPAAPKAMVTVRTGKVSVYRKDDFYEATASGNEAGGIVVTPNQELVYDQQSNELNKILTDKPEKVNAVRATAFVFDATPVSQVFKTLQEAYQIPIVYDEEALSSCSLSATMGNESFYEKLSIICKAINASYEMIDGNIIITAGGCK